jgi:hypothetical protein
MLDAGRNGLAVPFEISDLEGVPGAQCPCGISHRAFLRKDNNACTLHLMEVSQDAKAHYHKRLTEAYYFFRGGPHRT